LPYDCLAQWFKSIRGAEPTAVSGREAEDGKGFRDVDLDAVGDAQSWLLKLASTGRLGSK